MIWTQQAGNTSACSAFSSVVLSGGLFLPGNSFFLAVLPAQRKIGSNGINMHNYDVQGIDKTYKE